MSSDGRSVLIAEGFPGDDLFGKRV
jgi:hypothetical protein